MTISPLSLPSCARQTPGPHSPDGDVLPLEVVLGVDSESGFTHSAMVAPTNVHTEYPLPQFVHGQDQRVYGDNASASRKRAELPKSPNTG
jgi:hypothetical protein